MANDVINHIAKELRKAPEVALFSHISPDGDCLGSMLALGLALEKLGKRVFLFNPDSVPHNLDFLPGAEKVSNRLPERLPQALCFVDCTDLHRVNLEINTFPDNAVILNIDHHISNQNFGTFNWVDATASASGEIVMALIQELKVPLDQEIATNLYTAIVTDTGSFQYSNTKPKKHRLAADLMESGMDILRIHHRIFDQKPLAQVELLKRGLTNLELYAEGKLAVITLSQKDFEETRAHESLSEGVINNARSIEGVEVAVLFKEAESRKIRVGFRSNLWFNVNELAGRFGGGGHKRAAGCTMEVSLEEAKKSVIEAIKEELRVGRGH
jgi:phosphoesterase RecJ-like protein